MQGTTGGGSMDEQQKPKQQQQQQRWQYSQQPMFPPQMGFQLPPVWPMATQTVFMAQAMPGYQGMDYTQAAGMYGAYTPVYPQLHQQAQEQMQNGYRYGGSAYPPGFYGGMVQQQPVPWPPVPPGQPPWPANQDMKAESSSGRSPDKSERGWKRNRDGTAQKFGGGWQKNGNFRSPGNNRAFLRCESCDRTFTGRGQMEAHMKMHTRCNIDGCTFEGIGKAVTEHRQQVHMKKAAPRPLSKEKEEEIMKWREARRRNYPSAANLQRKLQDMEARRERGELVDEDAVKRQESLRQILAQQQALGCPVAEIPPYYLSERYTAGEKPSKMARVSSEENGGNFRRGKKLCVYFQKGHCRKGRRCTFLHDRGSYMKKRSSQEDSNESGKVQEPEGKETLVQAPIPQPKGPSLLTKLLSNEIKRDKSHLLQCFRFFVNNEFLQNDEGPLKFPEWEENPPEEGEMFAPLKDEDNEEDDLDEDDDQSS